MDALPSWPTIFNNVHVLVGNCEHIFKEDVTLNQPPPSGYYLLLEEASIKIKGL